MAGLHQAFDLRTDLFRNLAQVVRRAFPAILVVRHDHLGRFVAFASDLDLRTIAKLAFRADGHFHFRRDHAGSAAAGPPGSLSRPNNMGL